MRVNVEDILGTAVLKVEGRLNADVVKDFEEYCASVLKDNSNSMILDFTHLDYLSSAGLCSILTVGKKLKAEGGKIALAVPQGTVRQILELAGFTQLFPVFDTVEASLKVVGTDEMGSSAAIRTDSTNRVKIISVAGRIDASRIDEFKGYYTPLLNAGNTHFVFNFTEVDYLSSAGLCAILGLGKELQKCNGKMAIYVPRGTVRQILEISGFAEMFPICDTEEEAVWEVL